MASTNINYYQTQKDLQEIMHTSEQKRKQLEVQLQTYWQSDQKLAQLRTVKLQSYLRHISEDAQRSRQRNSRLLCDLDSVESRMAEIAARRHRLGELKEQYWAFIDRTYPQWVASTQNKLQEEQQQQQLKQQQQHQQQQQQLKKQQQQQQQQQQLQQQQRRLQEEENRHAIVAQQQSMLQNQQLQQQLFERDQSMQEQRRHQTLLAEENKIQRQKHQQQQKALNMEQEAHQRPESPEQQYQQQHKQQQRLMGSREEDDDSPPPLPHSPPPPMTSLHKNGYGDVMPDREYVNLQDVYLGEQDRAPVQPPLPFVTVHMPNVSHMEGSGSHGRSDPAKRGDQQGSLAERDGSVQSVSFSESMEVPISQPVRSVTVQQRQPEPQKQTLGPMAPTSEDEISDLMDDIDLPNNKDPVPHTVGNTLPDQAPPTSQAATVSTGRQDREGSDSHRSPHSVEPEMSVPSLLHLIKFLNDDISDALEVEGYYRSRNPDSALRKEIINKSKNKATLNGQDGQLVSMVLLEQLTPVVRHLPGACLLPDTLLKQDMDRLAATNVRSSLHRDAQPLWDKLLEHFVCLLRNHVMGSREMAYVFVPCLTHDNSLHQDKAVCLLERVIEELLDETETVPDTSSVTSPRSSQPGPAEIEAYKHLLSGTRPKWPAPTAEEHETDDNTYNADLENQFASNLSPRSPASTLKSGLGSGATAHQKKLGRMISSDLDTDTELEIAQDAKKDDHEDDDFYDFYG